MKIVNIGFKPKIFITLKLPHFALFTLTYLLTQPKSPLMTKFDTTTIPRGISYPKIVVHLKGADLHGIPMMKDESNHAIINSMVEF